MIAAPVEHLDDVLALRLPAGTEVVPGGTTRQESVFNALAHVSTDVVVVQDGARPFVTADLIDRTVVALDGLDGVTAAIPSDSSLKEIDGSRLVRTLDRTRIYQAQTPQTFRTETLRAAHKSARESGYEATDDADLVQNMGGTVGFVEGSRLNIKITWPEDLVLAEAIARSLTS